jgi:hypothetical protein
MRQGTCCQPLKQLSRKADVLPRFLNVDPRTATFEYLLVAFVVDCDWQVSPHQTADGKFRCVVVDSEPKAIRSVVEGEGGEAFRSESIVRGRSGRGGNFAFGFHDGGKAANSPRRGDGPSATTGAGSSNGVLGLALEAVRREAERFWLLANLVVVHSVSGGTGSGLGARIITQLRSEYPTQFLGAVAILPFTGGEAPTQHYNTILCVDVLQKMVSCSHDTVVLSLSRSFLVSNRILRPPFAIVLT